VVYFSPVKLALFALCVLIIALKVELLSAHRAFDSLQSLVLSQKSILESHQSFLESHQSFLNAQSAVISDHTHHIGTLYTNDARFLEIITLLTLPRTSAPENTLPSVQRTPPSTLRL
jgi:hypothetical protein